MRIFNGPATVLLLACGLSLPQAFAQGTFEFTDVGGVPASDSLINNQGTAGQGDAGSAYDQQVTQVDGITVNEHTSDVLMTENNMAPTNNGAADPYYIQNNDPLPNTHTAKVSDFNYQRITERVPYGRTQTGLLAPTSVNMASFQGAHTLGFAAPGPVTGPGIYDPQGLNWTGADGSTLPPTGTGEPAVDITPGGGYY